MDDTFESPKLKMVKKRIGEVFQELTKYPPGDISQSFLGFARENDRIKNYPDALVIPLPPPMTDGGPPLWAVIAGRRSLRVFVNDPMSLEDLGQVLWASQGITFATRGFGFRAAPSAGALYPTETYLAVNNVEDLAPGIYHYNVPEHALELLTEGPPGRALAAAALGQEMVARAAVAVIWTAVVNRSAWKYHQRAYRYIYLDTAHIAQNLMLAATALGYGTCGIGAFHDNQVNALLGVDGMGETTLYLCAVGKIKRKA